MPLRACPGSKPSSATTIRSSSLANDAVLEPARPLLHTASRSDARALQNQKNRTRRIADAPTRRRAESHDGAESSDAPNARRADAHGTRDGLPLSVSSYVHVFNSRCAGYKDLPDLSASLGSRWPRTSMASGVRWIRVRMRNSSPGPFWRRKSTWSPTPFRARGAHRTISRTEAGSDDSNQGVSAYRVATAPKPCRCRWRQREPPKISLALAFQPSDLPVKIPCFVLVLRR